MYEEQIFARTVELSGDERIQFIAQSCGQERLVNTFFGGDESTGTAISPEFTIQRSHIAFLIGGGPDNDTLGVHLLLGDETVPTVNAILFHQNNPAGNSWGHMSRWGSTRSSQQRRSLCTTRVLGAATTKRPRRT